MFCVWVYYLEVCRSGQYKQSYDLSMNNKKRLAQI